MGEGYITSYLMLSERPGGEIIQAGLLQYCHNININSHEKNRT